MTTGPAAVLHAATYDDVVEGVAGPSVKEITGVGAGLSRDQKGAESFGSVGAGGGRAPPGVGGSGRRRIGPSIHIRP